MLEYYCSTLLLYFRVCPFYACQKSCKEFWVYCWVGMLKSWHNSNFIMTNACHCWPWQSHRLLNILCVDLFNFSYIAYHGILDNISKNWLGMSWNESQMIIKVYDNFLGDDHANNKLYDSFQWSLWLFDVNSIQWNVYTNVWKQNNATDRLFWWIVWSFQRPSSKKGCISCIAFFEAKSHSPTSRKVTDPCA